MPSKTAICNLALVRIGVSNLFENVDTEHTKEADVFNLIWTQTVEKMLREFNWPMAKKIAALALVGSDPNSDWDFSYRWPADCLRPRRILSGGRVDSEDAKVVYVTASDSQGLLIYTDKEKAELEYTWRQTNPEIFPADFADALSWALAIEAAPSLAGPAGPNWRTDALKMSEFALSKARAAALNEEHPDLPPDGEFATARG